MQIVINIRHRMFVFRRCPSQTFDCIANHREQGRKSLRDALAKTYSPFLGWNIDPDKQVVVTTGAIEGIGSVIYLDYGAHIYEGILSAINAFVHPGDEVLIFEPFYDQSGTPFLSLRRMY